jgi:hypothetical protein
MCNQQEKNAVACLFKASAKSVIHAAFRFLAASRFRVGLVAS